ncbi:hypothetical protein V8F33_009213 [Rhypophila sp. PSN 637]
MFYQLLRVKPTASAQEIDDAYLEYTRAKERDGGRVNEHDSKEMVAQHIASLEKEAEQHRQFLEGAEIADHLEAEEGFSTVCQEVKDFRIARERQHLERELATIQGSIEEARREENTARPKTIETIETEDFGDAAARQLERETRAEEHRAARKRRRVSRSAGDVASEAYLKSQGDSGEEMDGVDGQAEAELVDISTSNGGSGAGCTHRGQRNRWARVRMTGKTCQHCSVIVEWGFGYRCCRCHLSVCRGCWDDLK